MSNFVRFLTTDDTNLPPLKLKTGKPRKRSHQFGFSTRFLLSSSEPVTGQTIIQPCSRRTDGRTGMTRNAACTTAA